MILAPLITLILGLGAGWLLAECEHRALVYERDRLKARVDVLLDELDFAVATTQRLGRGLLVTALPPYTRQRIAIDEDGMRRASCNVCGWQHQWKRPTTAIARTDAQRHAAECPGRGSAR